MKRKKPKKVCFIGAPSTGKTTLAKDLAKALRKKGRQTEWVREYARDFIIRYGPMKGVEDQFLILLGQRDRERKAEEKNLDFIVCDCANFGPYIYSLLYKLKTRKEKMIFKKIYNEAKKEICNYDYLFFLPLEFSAKEDGIRLYTDQALKITSQIKRFLKIQGMNYYQISGNPIERLDKVLKVIF